GSYTYTPDAGFSGQDFLTFQLADDDGDTSNYQTARFNVQPVRAALTWGDQPSPAKDSYNEYINLNNDVENSDNIPDNTESTLVPHDSDVRTLNLKTNVALLDGSKATST